MALSLGAPDMKHIPLGRRKMLMDRAAEATQAVRRTSGADQSGDHGQAVRPSDASPAGAQALGGARGPGGRGPWDPKSSRRGKAFDLFVDRGLHKLYDDIVDEPIPESLLRIIEDDRSKDDRSK